MRRAVILAGGQGRRLRPYTAILPKPLMPVGERPILEIVITQLKAAGFERVTLAVGHLAGLIQAFFGDGARFGIAIDYSFEHEPLGTAGPLALIDRPETDFVVMNGDVLTDLDFVSFYDQHQLSGAIATLGTYDKVVEISLGVLHLSPQGLVNGYSEKPKLTYPVSTGIYCFKPEALQHLSRGVRCDLPDFVMRLVGAGEVVRTHKIEGFWLDIGRPEDYELALERYG